MVLVQKKIGCTSLNLDTQVCCFKVGPRKIYTHICIYTWHQLILPKIQVVTSMQTINMMTQIYPIFADADVALWGWIKKPMHWPYWRIKYALWIGLRENLEETIDVPNEYRRAMCVCVFFWITVCLLWRLWVCGFCGFTVLYLSIYLSYLI